MAIAFQITVRIWSVTVSRITVDTNVYRYCTVLRPFSIEESATCRHVGVHPFVHPRGARGSNFASSIVFFLLVHASACLHLAAANSNSPPIIPHHNNQHSQLATLITLPIDR